MNFKDSKKCILSVIRLFIEWNKKGIKWTLSRSENNELKVSTAIASRGNLLAEWSLSFVGANFDTQGLVSRIDLAAVYFLYDFLR